MCVHLSLRPLLNFSLDVSLYVSASASTAAPTHLPVCQWACSSVFPSICLFLCVSVCLIIRPSLTLFFCFIRRSLLMKIFVRYFVSSSVFQLVCSSPFQPFRLTCLFVCLFGCAAIQSASLSVCIVGYIFVFLVIILFNNRFISVTLPLCLSVRLFVLEYA